MNSVINKKANIHIFRQVFYNLQSHLMRSMLQGFPALTLVCLLWATTLKADIKETYLLRVKGTDCLRTKKIDSAGFYFSKLINDTVHANATDYMSLSCANTAGCI